jgi:hypothetical protein
MNNEEPILPQLQGKTLMIPSTPSSQESFQELHQVFDKPKLYLRDILSTPWEELNKQQIFDQVAEHLFNQSTRSTYVMSFDTSPGCAYRGENGLACAIGSLVPDCEYNPCMESKSVSSLISDFYKSFAPVDIMLITFLQDLQSTHDAHTVQNWKIRLIQIAREYELQTEVLDAWDYDETQQRFIKKESTNIS